MPLCLLENNWILGYGWVRNKQIHMLITDILVWRCLQGNAKRSTYVWETGWCVIGKYSFMTGILCESVVSGVPQGLLNYRSPFVYVMVWCRQNTVRSSAKMWKAICCMWHYSNFIMDAMVSQITGVSIVYSTVYSGTDSRKHQSSASLAFVWGILR